MKTRERSKPPASSAKTKNPLDPPPAGKPTRRILVVANKRWEAAPLMAVLLETKAYPPGFPPPVEILYVPPVTVPPPLSPPPRARFLIGQTAVEVWCLQDTMDPKASASSTLAKIQALPNIFKWQNPEWDAYKAPDLVIAFGTASFPSETSYNGCVVLGSNVFIHDPFRGDNDPNHWHDDRTETLLAPTPGSSSVFAPAVLDEAYRYQVESRFLLPPLNPARDRILMASSSYTAVGVVNITNYDDYAWADLEAIDSYKAAIQKNQQKFPVGSLETTHGIIRLQSQAPFIFISGITDRVGYFNMEVGPRAYAQNFICAHNAGVAAAWLLPKI